MEQTAEKAHRDHTPFLEMGKRKAPSLLESGGYCGMIYKARATTVSSKT